MNVYLDIWLVMLVVWVPEVQDPSSWRLLVNAEHDEDLTNIGLVSPGFLGCSRRGWTFLGPSVLQSLFARNLRLSSP